MNIKAYMFICFILQVLASAGQDCAVNNFKQREGGVVVNSEEDTSQDSRYRRTSLSAFYTPSPRPLTYFRFAALEQSNTKWSNIFHFETILIDKGKAFGYRDYCFSAQAGKSYISYFAKHWCWSWHISLGPFLYQHNDGFFSLRTWEIYASQQIELGYCFRGLDISAGIYFGSGIGYKKAYYYLDINPQGPVGIPILASPLISFRF